MPRPRKHVDEFRGEIERRIAVGQTHTQIRSWLATEGVSVSKNTLSRRCVALAASRYTTTAASGPAQVSEIEAAFHTTHHDDGAIARNITAQGLPRPEIRLRKYV
jgi:hypothetical protein